MAAARCSAQMQDQGCSEHWRLKPRITTSGVREPLLTLVLRQLASLNIYKQNQYLYEGKRWENSDRLP